jgi:hypothetical protein
MPSRPSAQATIPHSSPSAVTGGSTPITTRFSASRGTGPVREASISARGHSAPGTSSSSSPSSSCRPLREPRWTFSAQARKAAATCGLSKLVPWVSTIPGDWSTARSAATGLGVVVTTACGRSPARRLSIRLSQVSSACRHLACSSHQA